MYLLCRLTLTIAIDRCVRRGEQYLTLEFLQFRFQLSQFGFTLLDEHSNITQGATILGHLTQLLGTLLDLELLAYLTSYGLFNLLQPYGHTALGQVLCEAIFMTELVQYRMLYVFALQREKERDKIYS